MSPATITITPAGRPFEPVRRPGPVAMLDPLRRSIVRVDEVHSGTRRHASITALAEQVEALAPFVSPIPVGLTGERLAAVVTGLQSCLMSTGHRCDVVNEIHHQVCLLLALEQDLKGQGPEELRDDLALTPIAIAAGATS